jgi:hypothetical protein
MIDVILSFFSNYLIETMGSILFCALFFRFFAYRSNKKDRIYYNTFTREIHRIIEQEKANRVSINNLEHYLSDFLGKISKKLPSRSLRSKKASSEQPQKMMSLKDYVDGEKGLISSIQSESSVFYSKTPPNFNELTYRVLSHDQNWTKLFGHIPIVGISRMIDILPGIFIILGVFGTFIGIAMALPEIAQINFNDLDSSSDTLMKFVLNVTYAMKTSIAGIFFSLILTILNTLFPIKEKRGHIFRSIENAFELLWYHIHQETEDNDVKNAIMQLNKNFERLFDKLEKIPLKKVS